MNSEKKEKVIILGKSGSGKNFLMRNLIEKNLKPCLKWTTRPQRKFEKGGIDYNFISESEFNRTIYDGRFLLHESFEVTPEGKDPQVWYYGITNEEFESSQVFIMTPSEFSKIPIDLRKGCFVVYLDIDRKVRESRIFKRDDKNDSIIRRLDADEIDFANLIDYDLKVTDPDFNGDDVYNLMD